MSAKKPSSRGPRSDADDAVSTGPVGNVRNKEDLLNRAQPLFTPTALDGLARLAEVYGVEKNDLAELLLLRGLGHEPGLARWSESYRTLGDELVLEASVAARVLQDLASGRGVAAPRVDRKGTRIYGPTLVPLQRADVDANVVAFRMAHTQDDPSELNPPVGGYSRPGLGMRLSMSPEEVWARSRGYWRIRPDADYTLATRLGYAPYLFKVAGWRTASDATNPADKTARFWAQQGWLVDLDQERLVPLSGSPEAEISDQDISIAQQLSGKVVLFPRGIRNPAVWIGRR